MKNLYVVVEQQVHLYAGQTKTQPNHGDVDVVFAGSLSECEAHLSDWHKSRPPYSRYSWFSLSQQEAVQEIGGHYFVKRTVKKVAQPCK